MQKEKAYSFTVTSSSDDKGEKTVKGELLIYRVSSTDSAYRSIEKIIYFTSVEDVMEARDFLLKLGLAMNANDKA